MFVKLIDALLDKSQNLDFWRGILYAVSGVGIAIKPEYVAPITSGALVLSGVLHTVWHKTHPAAE